MARGFMGYIGMGAESVWGTPVSASQYFEALSESIVTTKERFNVKNIVARMTEPDDEGGITRHQGDITMMGHPAYLLYALRGALGQNSVTAIGAGLFRNEFRPAAVDWGSKNSLPAYTLEIFRDVTSSERFSGGQFNTFGLSIAPNQELRVALGVIAKAHDIIAPSVVQPASPTYPTSPSGPFKFDTASISINGVAADRVEALNLTVDNQLQGFPALNLSTDVARIQRTSAPQVRIGGTIALADYADYLAMINETEGTLKMSLTKAPSFQCIVDVPRFIFTGHPHAMPGRDRITVNFTGMCRYHVGSGTPLSISVTDIRTV